ncbi:hypothetical protein MC885_020833 [Smutsia gigantea]|nr:hypothetical protein MC885_020833 [Smutsia gigantea]
MQGLRSSSLLAQQHRGGGAGWVWPHRGAASPAGTPTGWHRRTEDEEEEEPEEDSDGPGSRAPCCPYPQSLSAQKGASVCAGKGALVGSTPSCGHHLCHVRKVGGGARRRDQTFHGHAGGRIHATLGVAYAAQIAARILLAHALDAQLLVRVRQVNSCRGRDGGSGSGGSGP